MQPQQHSLTLSQLSLFMPFLRFAEERGYDTEAAILKLGMTREMFGSPDVFVSADKIYALVTELAGICGDDFLGIHVGETMDFSALPFIQDAARHSSHLGEFLLRMLETIPKFSSSVDYRVNIGADICELIVERQYQPTISTAHVDSFGIACFVRLFESVVGHKWEPAEVTVRTLDISGIPDKYKGMTIRNSNLSGYWIEIPTPWIYRRIELGVFPALNNETNAGSDDRASSVIDRFRSLVRSQLSNPNLSVAFVAEAMDLPVRQLQRELAKNNTSYRKEIGRMRVSYAQRALANSDQRITEIASQLGYNELAHFTRFFRTQTGLSPRGFRNQQRRSAID